MTNTLLSGLSKRLARTNAVRLVSLGYLTYIVVGLLLLSLPFAQRVSVASIDNLFIAASAVSTTGLVTVGVSNSYTFFGQLVVLILIQLGGIGYMTFGSFVLLSRRTALTETNIEVGKTVFAIPADFRIDKFIKSVIGFTLITETLGAIALVPILIRHGVENPVWNAVFHSISAFCTAGFSLFDTSFEAFAGDFWLNAVIGLLSIAGALGFIVYVDIWRGLRGKRERATMTTHVIVRATLLFMAVAAVLLFAIDTFDATRPEERILMSFFQSMTALTTVGFNTVPIAELSGAALLIVIVLMLIGASPSGTGGGIKVTTVTALVSTARATLRKRIEVTWRGNVIPPQRVQTAYGIVVCYLAVMTFGTFLLLLTEGGDFVEILFEAASALGTVGLSMGITGDLTDLGKLVVIAMMYLGRVGVLTFGMALYVRSELIFDDEKTDLVV